MNDAAIAQALAGLTHVTTLVHPVRNDILSVQADRVVIRSARTGRSRTIRYQEIRRAPQAVANGCVVRALAAHLGLPH